MGGREFETLLGRPAGRNRRTPMSRRCWPGRSFSRLQFSKALVRLRGDRRRVGGRMSAGVSDAPRRWSFYLAMMTATALELIGARGPTIVEGPFAGNALFARMLAAATGRGVTSRRKRVRPEPASGRRCWLAMPTRKGARLWTPRRSFHRGRCGKNMHSGGERPQVRQPWRRPSSALRAPSPRERGEEKRSRADVELDALRERQACRS